MTKIIKKDSSAKMRKMHLLSKEEFISGLNSKYYGDDRLQSYLAELFNQKEKFKEVIKIVLEHHQNFKSKALLKLWTSAIRNGSEAVNLLIESGITPTKSHDKKKMLSLLLNKMSEAKNDTIFKDCELVYDKLKTYYTKEDILKQIDYWVKIKSDNLKSNRFEMKYDFFNYVENIYAKNDEKDSDNFRFAVLDLEFKKINWSKISINEAENMQTILSHINFLMEKDESNKERLLNSNFIKYNNDETKAFFKSYFLYYKLETNVPKNEILVKKNKI